MTPADFPIIVPLLSDRRVRGLENSLRLMTEYEAEGVLLKVELANLKFDISNAIDDAWRAYIRERHLNNGKWESLTEEERKLEQSLNHPYPHVIAGYLKRVTAATKADGALRNDMLAFLTEAAPLAARLEKLKEIIGKRAPKPSKTSIARDERDAKAMRCQCCGRGILAETGKIAHHGYQRPQGWGYQTASCEGALELPFEVSRDALGAMIKRMEAYVVQRQAYGVRLQDETTDFPFGYVDISKKVNRWDRGVERTVLVNRVNYDAKLAEIAPLRNEHIRNPTFDVLKKTLVEGVNSEVKMVQSEIKTQQARYDGWVQTHAPQVSAQEGFIAWVAI